MSFPLNPFSIIPVANPFAGIGKTIHNILIIGAITTVALIIIVVYIMWHNREKIKQAAETGIKYAPLVLL